MHSLFIVTAAVKDWFNQQAELMGNKGAAIGDLCLSKNGKAPGTHGWCGVRLSAERVKQVEALLAANPKEAKGIDWTQYDIGKNPGWPVARLEVVKLKQIVDKPKLK